MLEGLWFLQLGGSRGGEEGKKLASDELEPVGTAGEGCLNG